MKINKDMCMGCHTCCGVCPMGAITVDVDGKCTIDTTKCVHCGTCASTCPASAISE